MYIKFFVYLFGKMLTTEEDERQMKIFERMNNYSIDISIICCPKNIFYLTKYQTAGKPFTALLMTSNNRTSKLITRHLECGNIRRANVSSFASYSEWEDCIDVLFREISNNDYIVRKEGAIIAIEKNNISQLHFEKLKNCFVHSSLNVSDWIDFSHVINELRLCKSITEKKYMRIAAQYLDAGLRRAHEVISRCNSSELTELDVAGEINHVMMKEGCEYTAYPTFVASGKNGCMAHHAASRKLIQKEETVFLEIGACHERYHISHMHTYYIGDEPEWYVHLKHVIFDCLHHIRTLLVDGTHCRKLYDFIYESMFSWKEAHPFFEAIIPERLGYGIGLGFEVDWSEVPEISVHKGTNSVLKQGVTIHIIPWIQLQATGEAIGFSAVFFITQAEPEILFEFSRPQPAPPSLS